MEGSLDYSRPEELQWCPICGRTMHVRCFHANGLCVDCEDEVNEASST